MTIQNERKELQQRDAMVELFELDYSALVGSPGNPVYVERFCGSIDIYDPRNHPERNRVLFDGNEYRVLPISVVGSAIAQGAPPRPRLAVANGDGKVSSLIDGIGGSLKGAKLTIRRIYSRHLDLGTDPDPRQEWTPEMWLIERKLLHTRYVIEFELAAPHDVQGHRAPGRQAEATMCPWIYKDPATCGWEPGAGPYFNAKGQGVADVTLDECGLNYDDCRIRFGAREQPLRFGGFPGLGRTYR